MHRRPFPLLVGAGLAAASWAALAATSPAGPPPPGRYDGRLCVSPLQGEAANCGPAELLVQSGNRAAVRISDIVYRLRLHSSQVDVVLMHGMMQIDGFTTFYDWAGSTLQFSDREKGLRYEVHFGAQQ